MMICDAHVHVGYYPRIDYNEITYHSPCRVVGVLNRCGVSEFIVSSTCAQITGIGIDDILREAQEIKRLCGIRAHIFFWLSGHLYDLDRRLKWLESGLIEGVKFHNDETPWIMNRRSDLYKILDRIAQCEMPVLFHGGINQGSRPCQIAQVAKEYPDMKFCIAHCRPMSEVVRVISECPNVWTDTAYMRLEDFKLLCAYDWRNRLMFGSDLPVWQAYENCSLTRRYREYCMSFKKTGLERIAIKAFQEFLNTKKKGI